MLKQVGVFTNGFLLLFAIAIAVLCQSVPPAPTAARDRFGAYHWTSNYTAWPFTPDRLNWGADLAKSENTRTFRLTLAAQDNVYRVQSEDAVWVEDAVPGGAQTFADSDQWSFSGSSPLPFFGASSHASTNTAGFHQHYFASAADTLRVNQGDMVFAYVYLDPINPPSEVMLQWNDGSWDHRAYWGANLISFGTDGSASRRYMGPLPATGRWVRLEAPAASVGLENSTLNGMAFTLYNGKANWDRAGATKNEAVWFDEAFPAGAASLGGETIINSNPTPYSGDAAIQTTIAAGTHQIGFSGANPFPVTPGDTLVAYVYLDPSNPPSEVMLQWNDGSWEHRAYWGSNLISFGVDGTISRINVGPLPPLGQWVRLEVPASQVGVGNNLNGFALTIYNGRATVDRVGSNRTEAVWIDDAFPADSIPTGSEIYQNTDPVPYSGNMAIQTPLVAGTHQIGFQATANKFRVNQGDNLFAYVYLDINDPPSEVMLQWNDGSWEHRAYWGANSISYGTDGTDSRRFMGPLPTSGHWARLEVPAKRVGLDGKNLNGFAVTVFNGRVTVDRIGKISDLAQMTASAAYDNLFRSPDFNTFMITAYSSGARQNNSLDGLTSEEELAERTEIGNLGDYLIKSGRYPNKTFILLNTEGDHAFWDACARAEYSGTPQCQCPSFLTCGADLFSNRWNDFKNFNQARANGVVDSIGRNSGTTAKLFSGLEFYLAETPYVWQSGQASYNADGSPAGALTLTYDPSNADYLKPHVPCGTKSNDFTRPFKFRCVSDFVAPSVSVDYYSYSSYEILNYRLLCPACDFRGFFKIFLSTKDDSQVVFGNGMNPAAKSVLKKIQSVRPGVGEANYIVGEWAFDENVFGAGAVPNLVNEFFGAFNLNDSQALHPSYLTYFQTVNTLPTSKDGLFKTVNGAPAQSTAGVAFKNNLP